MQNRTLNAAKKITALIAIGSAVALAAPAQALQQPQVDQPAPEFMAKDTRGQTESLHQYKGKFVVLEWTNHGCPYVGKQYGSGNMQALQKKYTDKGVVWLTVISSAAGKQGYSTPAEANHEVRQLRAHPTAVILDPNGKIGNLYGAMTTPDMYVIDPQGKLIYEGAIDDKPTTDKADVKTAKNFVASALDEAMSRQAVATKITKPYGCSVKY